MKCNFNTTPTMIAVAYVLVLALIFGTGILAINLFASIVLIVGYVLLILGLIFVINIRKGIIQADEENVCISRYFFGKYILKKSIAYCDIDSFKCHTELVKGKYRVKYRIVTVIKESNGNECVFFTNLDIPEDLPVNNPDKYNKILETHPMMELRAYVSQNIKAYLSGDVR
ncbi:MAG: hypothetical protein IJZ72_03060 [Oscillospiraceae bacterium]|nr:hypothetical protein [Oscillospiraceae bacterium]